MPSRLGYVIGTVLMVLAPIAAGLLVVLTILDSEGARDGDTRVPIPGERTVTLEAEKYIVYYEEPGSGTDSSPPLQIRVTPAGGGAPLPVSQYATDLTVASGGRSAIAVATIEPGVAGTYSMSVSAATSAGPGATAVLGRPFVARLALTLVGTVLLFLLPLLAGAIIVLVTFLRRRKARRAAQPPPPPWPGGPPQPFGH